jgi:hypothetical protein
VERYVKRLDVTGEVRSHDGWLVRLLGRVLERVARRPAPGGLAESRQRHLQELSRRLPEKAPRR